MPVQGSFDEIGFRFINDEETLKMFNELAENVQGKIILDALKRAAIPILQQAKTNLDQIKKGKSKTGYAVLRKAFKIEPRRKQKDELGVKIGITKEGYKYRWLNFGTDERYTERTKRRAKAYRGNLEKTNFFFDAVETKKEEAQNLVSKEIKLSIERTVAKYNAKDSAAK